MKKIFLLTVISLMTVFAFAQNENDSLPFVEKAETAIENAEGDTIQDSSIVPDIGPETTITDLLDYDLALYSALIVFLGFVQKYIPGINKIPSVAVRVVVMAIIAGLVFKFTGLANGWQLVLTYVVTSLGYDKLVAPIIGKSPKVGNEIDASLRALTLAGFKTK